MSTHYGYAPGGGVRGPRSSPSRWTRVRKVQKHGNSLTVPIPTGFLYQLNLFPGDFLELALAEDNTGFFARVLRREGDSRSTPPLQTSFLTEAEK